MPPRRQVISVCRCSSSVSQPGIIAAAAAASLISASWASRAACQVDGRRHGWPLSRRVVRLVDQPVVHGAPVQAAEHGHQVLQRAAPAGALRRTATLTST